MLTEAEIHRLRSETPACTDFIHFNNAGAGLMPLSVLDSIHQFLQLEAQIGGYEAAQNQASELAEFYTILGRFLNCPAQNVAVMASSTDAYAKALSSIPFKAGDTILTTLNDYSSNQLAFLSMKKRLGIEVIFAPDIPEGGVDLQAMETLIDTHRPRLVAVTHVPTNSGLVQPVEAVGDLCRERDILYLVDGCQSAGQIPLDVQRLKCDFLTASFRKFLRGPRGLGFLYVSDSVLEKGMHPLYIDLRGSQWLEAEVYRPKADATRFEFWEQPFALVMGARECLHYALALGLPSIQKRTFALAAYTRTKLREIPKIQVLDKGQNLSGIVTCSIPTHNLKALKHHLTAAHINHSIAFRENALRDFDAKGVPWALRLSPHYYNTYEEVDQVIAALGKWGQ